MAGVSFSEVAADSDSVFPLLTIFSSPLTLSLRLLSDI